MSTETIIETDFLTRAVRRMHEIGLIDEAHRDRMLTPPTPTGLAQQLGTFQALLAVCLWREETPHAKKFATHCKRGHEFTPSNDCGGSRQRLCRTCTNNNRRKAA